jgi:hypothetical protein
LLPFDGVWCFLGNSAEDIFEGNGVVVRAGEPKSPMKRDYDFMFFGIAEKIGFFEDLEIEILFLPGHEILIDIDGRLEKARETWSVLILIGFYRSYRKGNLFTFLSTHLSEYVVIYMGIISIFEDTTGHCFLLCLNVLGVYFSTKRRPPI